MEERRKEDEEINDFTRPAIGEGKDEIVSAGGAGNKTIFDPSGLF